ncbi:hypothetical protein ACSS7Z_01965 [Microbacterium sp. A82]|uniref:hypothetical protein n=1 Tax=unclassified Microbacterium TaxID=2609290 RepID=UPI003F3E90A5
MSERDVMFLVMFVILLSTLVVFVVQFVRSRRGKGGRGNWWEGPWDDDRKK